MGLFDLFRPKWKHSDSNKRLEAINEVTDQNVLCEISINDEDSEVRQAALRLISDWKVRKATVKRITDENILFNIAQNDDNWVVRTEAVWKINNEDQLVHIAKTDQDRSVAEAAVRRIYNKDKLINISQSEADIDIRKQAENQIKKVNEGFKKPYSVSERSLNMERNEAFGVLFDKKKIVRALWFADHSSAVNKMRVRMILSFQKSEGKTVLNEDYAAAIKGSCSIDKDGKGGYIMMFPSIV